MTMEQGTPAQLVFFRRLHKMLTNESQSSGSVVWLPDGLGFAILCKQTFTNEILPRYFGQSKFASFTRRLKRWGFIQHYFGYYYHSQFKRDMVFEDDYSGEGVDAVIPSRSKGSLKNLPLKKRFKLGLHDADVGISSEDKTVDIQMMPKLMRVIDREKRKERNELALLRPERVHVSQRIEDVMVARALASLELKVRRMTPSQCVKCSQPFVPIPNLMEPKTFSFSKAA